ncbi:MAG: hypothetical protein RIB93_23815 [Coleofasciculus sp. D1-CHI-01]
MELNTFSIYAKNSDKGQQVKSQVEKQGFEYSETFPDFMITVGGDGTYLEAERMKQSWHWLLDSTPINKLPCWRRLNIGLRQKLS